MRESDITDKKFPDKLADLLKHAKGEEIDIIAAVYALIQQEQDKKAAFQYFLEHADDMDSAEDREVECFFTASDIQRLTRDCERLIEGILDHLIGKNLDCESFYDELWRRGIEESTDLLDEKEKIYALFRIWLDGRIPYYKLDQGLEMTNEKFAEITESKEDDIKKMFFILNSKFSQKTERSSLLLKILDSCVTEEEKAVILAQMLSITESIAQNALMER